MLDKFYLSKHIVVANALRNLKFYSRLKYESARNVNQAQWMFKNYVQTPFTDL